MESGREGVIPLDKERMGRLNIYFNDINLRIDLAKKNRAITIQLE